MKARPLADRSPVVLNAGSTATFTAAASGTPTPTAMLTAITPADIAIANRLGYAVKLLAIAEIDSSGSVLVRVHPAMVPAHLALADTYLQMQQPALAAHAVDLVHARAESYLRDYAFRGDELVYVDPPYHPETRRQQRIYRHEYDADDHEALLTQLMGLPCAVIVSGYAHPMYDALLRGWRTTEFRAKTHTDVRTETLWFNFEFFVIFFTP